MQLSILHISDLHRSSLDPIGNRALLDSLEMDRARYALAETPRVRAPDLIVVSGDLIQGIKADDPNPDESLRAQYSEAYAFLAELTDRFVGGTRERVVIVPGNHDVSAYHFHKSLQRIDIVAERKTELVEALFSAGTSLRWSWSGFELYEVADTGAYAQRLQAFSEFYSAFYNGRRSYELQPDKQVDFFDFPEFGVTFVGFSSCHNNDLYNRQGAIHRTCIAAASERLRTPSFQGRVLAAVWHHNIEGRPGQSDYMDGEIIQGLIARDFSLGFHGHEHRPQFLDERFRYGKDRHIQIVSAGTLCGNPSHRHSRSYNIVELDVAKLTGRLHVREMHNEDEGLPYWGRKALGPGGDPFYDFKYDSPPEVQGGPTAATRVVMEAEALGWAGDWLGAAALLESVKDTEELARPLLLECFLRLKDGAAIARVFDPPANDAEAIHLMDALWDLRRHDRLRELLKTPLVAASPDPSVREMAARYAAKVDR